MESLKISVKGIVQGVGFRPFVYNLAVGMGVRGFVTNTADGVVISAEGEDLGAFVERVRTDAPPLSKIVTVVITFCEHQGFTDFSIRESLDSGAFTLVSPDVCVCGDCVSEMFDPNDRRYRYPFINCTNCGPRYSITRSVPYDRPNTTMAKFKMCDKCDAEYRDPTDRRFHAQPNACPECGPRVSLIETGGESIQCDDPIAGTIDLLKAGKILAIKGLGGYHFACDALNAMSVSRLREKKRKSNKPFGLMAPDIDEIEKYCLVSDSEKALLLSGQRPIVLLKKKEACCLPADIAPNNAYVGFMLPSTPLHYLLFGGHKDKAFVPEFSALVMTSGNISEEPIVTENDEALEKLSALADAFLIHDRGIFMRVDDSVIKTFRHDGGGSACFVRRSRGIVPAPVSLCGEGPDVMGAGADLKNTFTITKDGFAIMSQHIGDMENYETQMFYEETLSNLKALYRAEPVAIAHDLHPGYLSTRWALRQPLRQVGIQHHYAHVASVMAEKGITQKVIGVAFDGNGYGEDGCLWGGEFLIADVSGFKRAGHLSYVPLPGGEAAIKEPWRIAVSHIRKAAGDHAEGYLESLGMIERYGEAAVANVLKLSEQRTFSPLSSGAGRLFDAVAALTGVCYRNTFEGETAMALESLLLPGLEDDYPVDIHFSEMIEVDFCMTMLRIINDLAAGVENKVISTRFHNTIVAAVIGVALKLAAMHNIGTVVLSGGVFQNNYILERVMEALGQERLRVLTNELTPCNDAGISLGQAYIIRERIKAGLEV